MRKLLISVTLATAAMAAVPASAQYGQYGRQGQHQDWNQRGPDRRAVNQLIRHLDQVDSRIDRQARRGAISQREAFALNRQANQIRNRLARAGRDGLSGREFSELRMRVNRLEHDLRVERRDRDGRRG
jgi:TolA-binding protein